MAASSASPNASTAYDVVTASELAEALKVEVYNHKGESSVLAEVVSGKKTALIFTRHFWCLNCQAYVKALSKAVPPASLPTNTQVLIIGNGSWQPIDTYAETSASAYPIYTDPSLQLHKIFKFKSSLKEGNKEDQRDYMQDAGSALGRIWGGIVGALGHLEHTSHIGPKALNGGEVIISTEGQCEYIYRMQNTVDHTNISDLSRLIGGPAVEPEQTKVAPACVNSGDVPKEKTAAS